MADPFFITGPALISFSGGRTSAYMLRRILLAHGGTLPSDIIVTFTNTGKERWETLDFVRDCGEYWDVPIVWLEYSREGIKVVNYETAARQGEPFKALIRAKKFLPNPVMRFCTIELKIRVMRDYCRSLGWTNWTNLIGLRADEPERVASALARTKEHWRNAAPLAEAGITEADIMEYWACSNFDLRLAQFEGNCDLCFLKGRGKIIRIMQEHPELAPWWIEAEAEALGAKATGARFRADRPSYAELAKYSSDQYRFYFDVDDIDQSCGSECMAIDA